MAQCHTPTFKRLSWRSDSIDDDNSGTEEQWKQRIVNWLNAVAKWSVFLYLALPLSLMYLTAEHLPIPRQVIPAHSPWLTL